MKTNELQKIAEKAKKKSKQSLLEGEFVVGDRIEDPDLSGVTVVHKNETVTVKSGRTVVVFSSSRKFDDITGTPVRPLKDCTLTGPALFVESDIDIPILDDAYIEKQERHFWSGDRVGDGLVAFGITTLVLMLWVNALEVSLDAGVQAENFAFFLMDLVVFTAVPMTITAIWMWYANKQATERLQKAARSILTKQRFPLVGVSVGKLKTREQ